jgi:uncharacterized DUF497 family protein
VKYFDWDKEKNAWLIANRGVSFSIVTECVTSGLIVAIEDNHPPYEHQKIFIIEYEYYLYEVPYVEDGDKIFLKTIYPSRRAMRKYKKL